MSNNDKIKRIIEDLLAKMGISFTEILIEEIGNPSKQAFIIKTDNSGILIGTRGAHISALNHLVKRMAGKQLAQNDGDKLDFYINVNDYHEKLVEDIKNKAKILAERARSFKVNVEMEPMSSYERMIVHSFFENTPDIDTESQGVGDKRRVILKYKNVDLL